MYHRLTPPSLPRRANRYCSSCKEHRRAIKKMQFWKLPDILVLHLKRFEWRNAYFGGKINALVDFPLNGLDMSPHVVEGSPCGGSDESLLYDLVGVSNHFGVMGGGHYTAFARDLREKGVREKGRWIHFDDSRFEVVDEDEVVTEAAYLLFYQRRNHQ